MNTRIQELAEQAWVYQVRVYEDNGVRTFGEKEKVFSKEKFAELMVVEFTETVKQTATRIAQTGFNDGLSMEEVNKRVNGALFVLEVMRERFGVKS